MRNVFKMESRMSSGVEHNNMEDMSKNEHADHL